MHGYELIQQIQDKTGGLWVPSPGSIYPALQQLEDEGLVAFERVEGRKTATLTEAGTAYVTEHRAELGAPWDDVSGGVSGEARELRQLIGALMGAVHTVSHVGHQGAGEPGQRGSGPGPQEPVPDPRRGRAHQLTHTCTTAAPSSTEGAAVVYRRTVPIGR